MKFEEALAELRKGKLISRKSFNNPQKNFYFLANPTAQSEKVILDFSNNCYNGSASFNSEDIFADDWLVVDGGEV